MTSRSGPLTLDAVLDGALAVARRRGFDAVTMREVADELGVTPMAAYHYVSGKAQLVSLLVDRALDSIQVPAPDDGPWEVQLRTLAHRVQAVFAEYGQALTVNLQLEVTPAAQRLMHAGRRILAASGLPADEVDRAYGVWHMYTLGRLVFQAGTWRGQPSRRGARAKAPSAPETDDDASMRFTELEHLDYALDLFIAGVSARLRAVGATSPVGPPSPR
jgi:AcrR family transcriptional regulator